MLNERVRNMSQEIMHFLNGLGLDASNIKNQESMLTAFVHKSYSADYKNELAHNERLEFLGDSVLGCVISKVLYLDLPEYNESGLTLYKIALVREENLARAAKDIRLGSMLFLGKGEENSGGRNKDVILADAMEALIGAVYLEFGMKIAEEFVIKYVYRYFGEIRKTNSKSCKTRLQEKLQKQTKLIPEYIDIEYQKDIKNNVLLYKSEVYIGGEKISEGFGKNKKSAQEDAAKNYFEKFDGKNLSDKK